MLAQANEIRDYNFRTYFVRKINDQIKEHREVTDEEYAKLEE
jgi:hypothetical protein